MNEIIKVGLNPKLSRMLHLIMLYWIDLIVLKLTRKDVIGTIEAH